MSGREEEGIVALVDKVHADEEEEEEDSRGKDKDDESRRERASPTL